MEQFDYLGFKDNVPAKVGEFVYSLFPVLEKIYTMDRILEHSPQFFETPL